MKTTTLKTTLFVAVSLVLLFPLAASAITVTDPASRLTATIDPAGSKGLYGPIWTNPSVPDWRTIGYFRDLPQKYVLGFEETDFTAGQALDQVVITGSATVGEPAGNTITFTGLTIGSSADWATSGTGYLTATTKTQDQVSASISFASPVQSAGLAMVALNAGGLRFQFYTSENVLLGSLQQSADGGRSYWAAWTNTSGNVSNNIARIDITPLWTSNLSFGIDDLAFTYSLTQIPEPAAVALLAGAAGVCACATVVLRRKRR